MKLTKRIFLCFFLFGSFLPCWGADAPRVAVLDFTLAHSPGSIDPAALDFSRAVQAKLFSNNDYSWVERQEFDRITQETDLGGISQTDPATAVRLGHLLRSDLMLRGEITVRSGGVSDLTLEVIDLKKADVLTSRILPVTSNAQKRLHPTALEVEATGRAALELLKDARLRLEQMSGLSVLAPLYFKNTGKSDRLGFLEERLRKSLDEAATPATGFRTLRFPQVSEAGEEASLVLTGLTDTDPEVWQHVADGYVWGTFSEQGGDGFVFEDVPVAITLQVWNGTGDAQEVKWTGTVKDLDAGLRTIAARTLMAAKIDSKGSAPKELERQKLAADLKRRAMEIAYQIRKNEPLDLDSKTSSHAYLDSTAGRQLYTYWLRLLEVACFFDPVNRSLQQERLQLAWSSANPLKPADSLRGLWLRTSDFQLQAKRFERLPGGDLDNFWPASQSERLAEFADSLDKTKWASQKAPVSPEEIHRQLRDVVQKWSRVLVKTNEAVVREAKKPVWYEAQQQAWFKQASFLRKINDPIIVRDALEKVWPVLQNEFGRALKSDKTVAAGWIEEIFSTYNSFADSARPIAMLDSAWASYKTVDAGQAIGGEPRKAQVVRPPTPAQAWKPWMPGIPVPLPPTAEDAKIQVLAATIREIDPRPITAYERTSGTDEVLFKKRRASNLKVASLAYQSGKLWFSEENEELPAALGKPNALGAHYLWCYDPALRSADLITAKTGDHVAVRNLLGSDGALWLGLDGDGVWKIDPEGRVLKRFKGEDGLQAPRVWAATKDRDQLYFVGGTAPEFFVSQYSLKEDKWTGISCPAPATLVESARRAATTGATLQVSQPQLAVHGDWICFTSDWTAFFNQSTKQWTDLLAAPGSSSPMSAQQFTCCSADDSGFWLGNGNIQNGSVLFLNPSAPAEVRRIKVPGRPVAIAHHGPWLWTILEYPGALSRLALIDKRSGTFVGQMVLPGQNMRCLVATDDRVWVGGDKQTGRSGLWEDGSALLEVTLQEPRPAATTAKAEQPADYYLNRAVWNGDPAKVESLLASKHDANEAAVSGWTPLMSATAAGRHDLATLLLAGGANPNLLSREGDSALQQAAERGDANLARLLLQHGAKPNLQAPIKMRGMTNLRPILLPQLDSRANSILPTQPTGLKATFTPEGEVLLSWEDLSDNEMQFEISYKNSQGMKRAIGNVPADTTSWIDPEARPDDELIYSVRAVNDFNSTPGTLNAAEVRIKRPTPNANIIRFPYGCLPGSAQPLPVSVTSQAALSAASAGGYTEIVALLLESGADPNLKDAAGSTPLITAVRHRQYGTARQLLAAGARPEVANSVDETAASIAYQWHEDEIFLKELLAAMPATTRGREASTLLLDAAGRGQIKDMEMLLAQGGEMMAHDSLGQCALSVALMKRQSESALLLLKWSGAKLQDAWRRSQAQRVDEQIARGAIFANSQEILSRLLEIGLDVNRYVVGKPMVAVAAETKSFITLKFLVEHGANVGAKDFDGKTVQNYLSPQEAQLYLSTTQAATPDRTWPFPRATTLKRAGPPAFLTNADPAKATANEALIVAAQKGDLAAAVQAVAAGAELDCHGSDGKTPLLCALKARAFEVAHWLVEEGASVNRTSKGGYSPIAFALDAGNPDFVDYLLMAGSDLNVCGKDAYTPLAVAVNQKKTAAVRQLLEAGADANLSVRLRELELSPLAIALGNGDVETVNLLLAHRANPKAQLYHFVEYENEIRKKAKPSLLMHAAYGGNVSLIEQMISFGQDPGFKTSEGYDALSWAAGAGLRNAVEFLLPLSAKKGNALESASEKGRTEIAEILKRAGYQSGGEHER